MAVVGGMSGAAIGDIVSITTAGTPAGISGVIVPSTGISIVVPVPSPTGASGELSSKKSSFVASPIGWFVSSTYP